MFLFFLDKNIEAGIVGRRYGVDGSQEPTCWFTPLQYSDRFGTYGSVEIIKQKA